MMRYIRSAVRATLRATASWTLALSLHAEQPSEFGNGYLAGFVDALVASK